MNTGSMKEMKSKNGLVEIKPLSPLGLEYIVSNVRPTDLAEFEAVGMGRNDMMAAGHASAVRFQANYKNAGAFAFGFVSVFPHVWDVWGFGTDKTSRVLPQVTRFIKTEIVPRLTQAGIKRVEVRLPTDATDSLTWLSTHAGATVDCLRMKGFGMDGQDFALLSWTADQKEAQPNVPITKDTNAGSGSGNT